MLQVQPSLRPNCDKILQMPAVIKRLTENILQTVEEVNPELMKTIIIPKNLHYLTDRLPKPNYTPLKTSQVEKYKFLQTLAGYKHQNSVSPPMKEKKKQKSSGDSKKNSYDRRSDKEDIIQKMMLPPLRSDAQNKRKQAYA